MIHKKLVTCFEVRLKVPMMTHRSMSLTSCSVPSMPSETEYISKKGFMCTKGSCHQKSYKHDHTALQTGSQRYPTTTPLQWTRAFFANLPDPPKRSRDKLKKCGGCIVRIMRLLFVRDPWSEECIITQRRSDARSWHHHFTWETKVGQSDSPARAVSCCCVR